MVIHKKSLLDFYGKDGSGEASQNTNVKTNLTTFFFDFQGALWIGGNGRGSLENSCKLRSDPADWLGTNRSSHSSSAGWSICH